MAKASPLLIARESFVSEHDGSMLEIRQGDLIEADHPLARKHPNLFSEPELRFPVEQATAAPGEKRILGIRSKPKAAPKAKAEKAPEPKPEPEPEPEPVPQGKALKVSA